MDALSQFVLAAAGTPWALLAMFCLIIIDGIFPLVPSESIVIGLAAIGVGTGHPSLLLLGFVAAVAAFIGDNLAYEIGRAVGLRRFRWMRHPRFVKVTDWAAAALQRRVSSAVLAGRFVPGGRVAISLVAGATKIPRTVYRPLTAASSSLWAVYSLVIGTIGGAWVSQHPILGALLAVALGIAIGFVIDKIITLVRRRRDARRARTVVVDRAPGHFAERAPVS
ncbi:DedA family protein [Microlunatus elymi]|uniref:DedA family protein n=1 Tax=Microlunatus elymi TaxID=2596828 RepID=A0A516PXA2_9ACTN|nr:VTT domain-containing protein [Microlunatus elymi]QDP95581.1 DedA family protein [Microlunatus elymi]